MECTPESGRCHSVYSVNTTIIVPVVYMARDVMIWMRANTFRGPLEGVGVGPENFFMRVRRE
jgi:hypothetical protein